MDNRTALYQNLSLLQAALSGCADPAFVVDETGLIGYQKNAGNLKKIHPSATLTSSTHHSTLSSLVLLYESERPLRLRVGALFKG